MPRKRRYTTEQTEELGYEPYEVEGKNSGNSRNGHYNHKMRTSGGDAEIRVPRDRNGNFHSVLLQKTSNEIEQKVIAMYAKGTSTRDIQALLDELWPASSTIRARSRSSSAATFFSYRWVDRG